MGTLNGGWEAVFTCILKNHRFYDWFFIVFVKYGLLGSIQGLPQDSQVHHGSFKLASMCYGLKV